MQADREGLTEQEVLARRARGQGNQVQFHTSRTWWQIVRGNILTFINTVLFGIGIMLILMGRTGDALVTAGLVLLNAVIGIIQEGQAKRQLDRIALLTRPKATVVRAGQEHVIDPDEIVLGDVLVIRAGDQIVADGTLLGEDEVEMDESLLTGESERVRKEPGAPLYSGSFAVSGAGRYEAQQVGAESLANRLTAQARAFRQVKTPLQREVDLIIRVLILLVSQLGLLLALSFALRDVPLVEGIQMSAVIVALVPQGLFFMTTVAYAMGAVRVVRQGALIQQANAVEAVSRVNLLCLDKTGTLTTNRLQFQELLPLDDGARGDEEALRRTLGDYAASTQDQNQTIAALHEALQGQERPVQNRVPFASAHKWSALAFTEGRGGSYILGAPEVLEPQLTSAAPIAEPLQRWTAEGRRVLLFAHHAGDAALEDADGEPQLPDTLAPLALVSLRDELRPEAQETLEQLRELGIRLKVISGDNPETVAALCRQIGWNGDLQLVSGPELEAADEAHFAETARGGDIFGRITPQQKERLIRLFREQGDYVAMIGDGVNDVLSLKEAQVGVAMESGSQAARAVADMVLLKDSFAALPVALREGQRIIKGMEDVVRLLLTRTLYVTLLIIATQLVGVAFPITPKHNSVLALITVGLPILAIAAWARPGTPPPSILRSTSHFVLPAAFTISLLSLLVYLSFLEIAGVEAARAALTTFTVLCGLLLIPFVEPPTPAWVGGDELSGDRRPTLLALALLGLYVLILALPPLRAFFELTLLRPLDYALLILLAAGWALLLRWTWRRRLLERFLAWEQRPNEDA